MPFYVLECIQCRKQELIYRSIAERDVHNVVCCAIKMRRIITQIGAIIYKGNYVSTQKLQKIENWSNFVEETCSQPAEQSEIQEGLEMIAERKKLKEEQRVARGTHKLGINKNKDNT